MDTTLTIKTKKELRDEVKKTAAKLGIPVTIVVNSLLKQFVRDREIVLSLNIPNAETRRALDEVPTNKNTKTFKSLKAFKTHLNSI